MRLTVLSERGPETALCTYCPKLCRPACPVSTVEARETVTPWGKMRAMGEIGRGVVPTDEPHAAPAYACTGCMRCFELCDLDNPVADTLRDGRVEAVEKHVAPAAVSAFLADFTRREDTIARASAMLAPQPAEHARTVLFPGCTSVVFARGVVDPLRRAVGRIVGGACASIADACCGFPLLEAGDRDGFVIRARALAGRLQGFDRVVTGDAGCAHAMRVMYPRFGIALPRVQHVAEIAAAALGRVPRLEAAPEPVVYHDPCRLGRGLGVYDEPRAVLTKLLGKAPGELAEKREYGACSGGGGLLPVTRPETAAGIARELAGLVRESRSDTVVTACATSKRMMERAGLAALDLSELIARALA
jgi:Fe-S oxidoreductase